MGVIYKATSAKNRGTKGINNVTTFVTIRSVNTDLLLQKLAVLEEGTIGHSPYLDKDYGD